MKTANETSKCKLILYRTKQNVLANITLQPGVSKIFIKNECIQCQDDEQNFWSIVFEANDIDVVLKEIDLQYLIREHNDDTIKQPENKKSQNHEDIPSKATILSRMAKMGKPLPQLPASTTSEISDSSDQDDIKPVPIAHPRRTINKIVPVKNFIPSVHHTQTSSVSTMDNHTLIAYNPDTSGLNILLADNRSQNTEIRMNLSKLDTKIEKVLEKIDLLDIGRGTHSSLAKQSIDREAEELELESKILELKKENRQLRIKMLAEQSSMAETKRNNQLEINEEKVHLLEEEIKRLHAKELENVELINMNQSLKLENERQHILIQEKCDEINLLEEKQQITNGTQQDKLKELEKLYEKCDSERIILKNDKETEVKKVNELQEQVNKLTEEMIELKQKCNESAIVNDIVKSVMNGLYQKLHNTFSEQEMFTQKEILKITATTIKSETLAALKK